MTTPKNASDAVSDTLEPAGKGLPRIELWVARVLVGWQARRTSRQGADRLFADERARVRRLVESVPEERASRRVLIPRLRGMEDSSRYWSVYMTLDHLRIVDDEIAGVIVSLVRGAVPARAVSTADVKPSPTADRAVMTSFERSCDVYTRTVDAIPDLNTKLTWPHPWFGPFDAARWHFLTAFHMGLHRRQIEVILATRS